MDHAFLRTEGETYLDFKVLTCTEIKELDCFFRELVHIPTGAHVIHIENEDPENLFCLSFRTLPHDSKGTPHILEHIVLCGSEKFPIKDPFFSMTRRSLNTFMNALTGSDFTCYPAASQVEKDFYNLLTVYLDAVFHAELKYTSFLQEGYRVEFEEPEDPTTPLKFKGIVYNEMKGSITPESKLWHASLESLFPDLPYAYNSGGDPKEIPTLSFQELTEFYQTYYHPSRCLFFFYGSFPLKKHLDFIQEQALKGVSPLPTLPPIQKQPRFLNPKKQQISYAVTPEDAVKAETMVSFAWLTCSVREQEEALALSVLDSILMDTDASPLKKVLLQSGLCKQVDAHIDTDLSEIPYVLTFKGCDIDKIGDIEATLFETLEALSKKPFAEHLIEASIHQLELSRTEISADHGPFGLNLFFRCALAKQHGGLPENMLKTHSLFQELLNKVKDPFYLPNLLKKHLVTNPHRVQITMVPDPELAQKDLEEEKKILQDKKELLTPVLIDQIIQQAKELEEIQAHQEEQDLECLPKVTLQDVPLLSRDFPLNETFSCNVPIFHHECFTNSILYADLVFDMPALLDEEIPYLQLMLSILPELGAGGRDYTENLEYTMSYTGGVSTSSSLHIQADNYHVLKPALLIRGKALERNAEKLFILMKDILTTPDFTDKKRLEELIKQIYSSMQNRVSKNALRYAIQLSLSGYSNATHFSNSSQGLTYYHFIEKIAQNLTECLDSLVEKFQNLHSKLFSFHNTELVLSCDKACFEKILQKNLCNHLQLPNTPFTPWKEPFPLTLISSQGRIINSQVAYNVKSYAVSPYSHPYAPALSVSSQLFDHVILHNKIREIGGAYGSSANYNAIAGCFYFYSYRDPHIANTFSVFEEAVRAISDGHFNNRDLDEAKLSIIQHLDTPISPGSQALLAYSWKRDARSKSLREHYRNNVLNLTISDIQKAVKQELLDKEQKAIRISFASKDLLEKEGKQFPHFSL